MYRLKVEKIFDQDLLKALQSLVQENRLVAYEVSHDPANYTSTMSFTSYNINFIKTVVDLIAGFDKSEDFKEYVEGKY